MDYSQVPFPTHSLLIYNCVYPSKPYRIVLKLQSKVQCKINVSYAFFQVHAQIFFLMSKHIQRQIKYQIINLHILIIQTQLLTRFCYTEFLNLKAKTVTTIHPIVCSVNQQTPTQGDGENYDQLCSYNVPVTRSSIY